MESKRRRLHDCVSTPRQIPEKSAIFNTSDLSGEYPNTTGLGHYLKKGKGREEVGTGP
jgi:hypothetical protein